jgi:excisionase family DNA binding protein
VPLQPHDPQIASTAELARDYGVHPKVIRRLVRDGVIPVMRVGRVFRFHRGHVIAALEAHRVPVKGARTPAGPDFDAIAS